MLRQRKYRAIYPFIVALWLTLSVASVMLAAICWAQLSQTVGAGRQLTAIRLQIDGILKTMLDSETGVRGYIITGNTNYLDPYTAAQSRYEAEFDRLADMAGGDPAMLNTVVDLRALSESLADFNRQTIEARKHDFRNAEALVATGKGKHIMDQIRDQISVLDKICYDERSDESERFHARLSRAILTSLVAGVIGIIAGIFAFGLARITIKNQERERELVEAKLQAERNSREKSAFLANMSHEIRTPMNAILGFSELLQGELTEPRHRKYLHSIRSSATSLLQLINDILDMSKIEAGAMELRPEPTDSHEICDFIRTLFSEPAARKEIKLECHVAEDLPRALLIDRVRLRQILVNLVGNSIKFTDHGRVDVRVSSQKQKSSGRVVLAIEVADTGVGIPGDKLDAIFKPFVQAGAHRDKEMQGTGLGLSIVKRLTELMGGSVTVTSTVGKGSVFSLRFPNVPVSARLPASAKILPDHQVDFNKLRPSTLLVADDNEGNRQYLAGIFQNTHHRLIFCSSGEEAIIKAGETAPDIVLLDVRMPGLDGRQALEKIRKIAGLELVPAIAVTGSAHRDDAFSAYVRKPFSTRDLFDELAEFLPRFPASDAPASGLAPLPQACAEPVPEELLKALRLLLVEPWPGLCNSMATNEIKSFARRLDILAKQWHYDPLAVYAGTLMHNAETYAVIDLEKNLGDFAGLVEEFAQKKENGLKDENSRFIGSSSDAAGNAGLPHN